ncbi:MAG TPA: O-antigen ligase family protein [Candidatus Binatia bacterium]|nr:O-antigen ligase family protein [Candidatus Binatia bacterium]
MVLVTCFAVASFAPRLHPVLRVGLLTACVVGIFAANYRTSLIALAPLAIGFFTFSTARSFTSRQRMFVGAATLIGAIGVTLVAAWALRERMADIAIAAGDDAILKPPGEFNETERALFSGRIYLWSSYLHAYLGGDDLRILFGFGPDAWIGVFSKYAHNTVISYLYEFGLFGALLIVCVWIGMLMRARAISDPWLRGQMLFAHAGFIILNFATMPHWQLEGLILYGLLCGYTIALTSRARVSRSYRPNVIPLAALPQRPASGGQA